MRILTKYCLREEFKLFLAALLFFSGLLLLGQVMNLLRLVLHEGVVLSKVLSIVLLWFPSGISYSIPMSLLFAVLMGYGQMAQQEELTAIRAAGVSPAELLSPAIFLGAALSFALFANEAWVAPPARILFREKLAEVRNDVRIENLISPGQLFTFGPIRFSCREVDPGGEPVFKNIFFEYSDTPAFRITAESARVGRIGGRTKFLFENGQILWTSAEKHLSVKFESAEHVLPMPKEIAVLTRAKDMSVLDLWRGKEGRTPEDNFEFHKKSALILAPFFFACFASTLSILIKRGNRVLGFILTLSVLAGYYILLAVAAAIQPASHHTACMFVWLPNAVLLGFGYFFYRMVFLI